MTLERWIRAIAGSFVIIGVTLSYVQSQYWLFFVLFVGLNLFQSAFTGFCLMENILRRLGVGQPSPNAFEPLGGDAVRR
jgi:Inner membrane protein YgaP-like, transmembrane domain